MGHIFFVPQQVNNLDFAISSQAQGLASQIPDTQIPTNMIGYHFHLNANIW
jgi:hypothetical protein